MNHKFFVLKLLKKIYGSVFKPYTGNNMQVEKDPNIISRKISDLIESEKPCMIARYGATELMCIVNYLGVKNGKPNLIDYILNKEQDWWWNLKGLKQLEQWSGFFPPTIENVTSFCELMLENSSSVDILASWLSNEQYMEKYLKNSELVQGLFLDPFWSKIPWTKALRGRRILVIHPFESAIISQYQKRKLLFKNQDILPEFELLTIKAVQSLGGECGYTSWFNALNAMKDQIDQIEFDISLLGCGAYGFPLAAYIKSKGKKAIHVGGSLQLLFGIKGKRWENPDYGAIELNKKGQYLTLFNEHWIYPGEEGKPKNAQKVENGCYW